MHWIHLVRSMGFSSDIDRDDNWSIIKRFFLHLTHRPEFLLESLHTCSFCHHDLLFFPLPLVPHPTSSLTLSEKDTLLTEPEEILDSPEEEMKTKKKKTLKMNLLNKKSKKIIGSRKM